mgnify:CR=1 FL=1
MGSYAERILPHIIDLAWDNKPAGKQREKIVPLATGDVLAVVESPELESRLAQERATLDAARSDLSRLEISVRQQNLTNEQRVELLEVRPVGGGEHFFVPVVLEIVAEIVAPSAPEHVESVIYDLPELVDGRPFLEIRDAIDEPDRPSLICCRTTIANGAPNTSPT